MATKAQLEKMLLNANDRIIALQQQVPAETPKDYLYHAYSASAAVLEDYYVPNHISWADWMEREELTDAQLESAAWARFAHTQQEYLVVDYKRPHRSVVQSMKCTRMTTKRLGRVPWVLTWFAHQTFRDGRSDRELEMSFDEYVEKYRWMQEERSSIKVSSAEFEKRHGEPYVCLMGAEDRWRWKLCECQPCKDRGIAVFQH
jgi:hypothetical protein